MCAQNSPQPVRYLITSAQQGSLLRAWRGGGQPGGTDCHVAQHPNILHLSHAEGKAACAI